MFDERKSNGSLTVFVTGMLLLAASGFVWSKSRSAGTDAVAEVRAATASALSPMELMLQHSGKLPTERWDSF